MKQFINLTPKESVGLDVSIYKNALQLKHDALLIASERKSFSSATSLLILSSEEVIKSILVRLHAENYNIYKLEESSKFFRDHKIRHQIAQLMEMGSGLIESYLKYEEQEAIKLLKIKSRFWDDLLNGIIDVAKSAKPILDSNARVKELQGFNDLKNKGFYVDYRDDVMLPQSEISEDVFKSTLVITERVFRFSKLVRVLFHEKIEDHRSLGDIKNVKDLLKDFIDNAMTDFSFKELNRSM